MAPTPSSPCAAVSSAVDGSPSGKPAPPPRSTHIHVAHPPRCGGGGPRRMARGRSRGASRTATAFGIARVVEMNPRSEQEHLGWRVHRAVPEFRAAAQRYGSLAAARRSETPPQSPRARTPDGQRVTADGPHELPGDTGWSVPRRGLRYQARGRRSAGGQPADGRTGNFCASVGLENGTLRPALRLSAAGIGTGHPSPLTRGVRSVSIAILSPRWHLWPV